MGQKIRSNLFCSKPAVICLIAQEPAVYIYHYTIPSKCPNNRATYFLNTQIESTFNLSYHQTLTNLRLALSEIKKILRKPRRPISSHSPLSSTSLKPAAAAAAAAS